MSRQEEITALRDMTGEEKKDLVEQKPKPFLRIAAITEKKRNKRDVIKSGITDLDSKMIGFNRGEMTIVSGSNGSGKSSWLSQMAVEAANQGYKTALFSGELTPGRVLRWLMLPAAGRMHTERVEGYENFYAVKDSVKPVIREWLNEWIFLYNNAYSMKADDLIPALERCMKTVKLGVVIIDNLMALDIRSAGADKYERQTRLVNELSNKAKEWNVHIFFVCHPRKSIGFLRKEDISGSSDLTNAADNVLIVHRVGNDFSKRAAEMLGSPVAAQLGTYDNVIEVCKNRELGVQDLMCGMYYDRASSRFMNEPFEERRYGWEGEALASLEPCEAKDTFWEDL